MRAARVTRYSRITRLALSACLAGALASVAAASGSARSRADADAMLRKIAIIATNGLSERPASRRTPVTEGELNSFLEFHARGELPAGVMDPAVMIADGGRLTGRAIVDLDEVRKSQNAGGLSVLSLLGGRVPVEAIGVLRTTNGVGQFSLESAAVGGMPVPKAVLQEVVAYYSRTPETPDGIDLDAPFELPVRIREIQTSPGQAIVVQ
jgi:hypothetical protein